MPATFIYRFARDLRVDDHAGLAAAAAHGAIVPVLVLDRELTDRIKRSPRRAAFFCSAAAALDGELRARGSRLIVKRGSLAAALREVARDSGAGGAAWSASYDAAGIRADAKLQSALEEAGLVASIVHDAPAVPPEETDAARVSEGAGYRAFSPYYEIWKTMTVGTFEAPVLQRFAASEIESEPLPQPAEFDALDDGAPAASPPAARTRLAAFLRESVTQYSVAMNVPADDRTSHLSADLAFGTIAARTVVRETQMRAEDPFLLSEERLSVRLFLRSLAQRDFFLQLGWFHADYGDAPLQEKMHGFSFARTHAGLEAWCAGATGFPLVDAGIRQLRATGWMHPHVRAVCASFLCFDLGVDWRVGRDEWDRHQIEDDPAIGTGNWQWIAGVGADMAQYPRIYNPERQRRRYDPNGTYVKRWVPELARLPVSAWHERLAATQITLPLFGDQTYARPIVNHETAAREFLKRYRAFVRS
ncbi:MAG: FAD-binding domain-containing protein [Vulcanimicrobiaceae bacterium]